ncbi:MAG: hypothetical protein H7Y36_00175 [Armatimonadetes bacterium]|nr:hypothetical protein [Akkermansiaceae bacterium]
MKFHLRLFPFPTASLFQAFATCCLLLGTNLFAQTPEEYELQNGKRVPADSVKPTANGFTAKYFVGTAEETINFTAKDVIRTTVREPKELNAARSLIVSEKPEEAIELLSKLEPALLPFQAIPNSWWQHSAILRMDALSVLGKNKEAAEVVSAGIIDKLSPEDAIQMEDFQKVVAPPGTDVAGKLSALKEITGRSIDSWIGARVWLEIGNTHAYQGKMEDAVKSWLRVPVFFPAERDLAARGTILAARGLGQIDRQKDGFELINDYLSDHPTTPYKETFDIEAAKLDPQKKKPESAGTPPVSPGQTE